MDRRSFLQSTMSVTAGASAGAVSTAHAAETPQRNTPLADDYTLLWKSPDPTRVRGGTPGMTRLPSGRLVATFHVNGRADGLREDAWGIWRGRVMLSDDHGRTWRQTAQFPMADGRPIVAGTRLYIVGHNSGIVLTRSGDGGQTWTQPTRIRQDEPWTWYCQACSVVHANGRVYFTIDRVTEQAKPPTRGVYAPIVFSAKTDDDWMRPDAWTLSNTLTYDQATAETGPVNLMGYPFYTPNIHHDERKFGRITQRIGWFESNVVQITDPEHIWNDPDGRTFHIFMRAHTSGGMNVCALAKAVHGPDGDIDVSLEHAPSGAPMVFAPMPGGQNRFHITYDPVTRLYWLVSLQTTDSMKRIELLNPKRWNLPNNERHRLALHFSKNCVDWVFAGLIANTQDDGQSRHYGPGVIDGDDFQVLSRSASPQATNAHNADMVTLHTVRRFRDLVY